MIPLFGPTIDGNGSLPLDVSAGPSNATANTPINVGGLTIGAPAAAGGGWSSLLLPALIAVAVVKLIK